MNRVIQWVMIVILTTIYGTTLCASCKADDDKTLDHQPTIERIVERGTMLVGTTGDYRPLSYKEPDSGEYWGFDLDVAGEIAKALNVTITYVPTSWPTLSADVQNPELFDFAIGGITITDVRKETMDMSDGYLGNGKTILCRKADGSLQALSQKYGLVYTYRSTSSVTWKPASQ